jgi:hypothetical protein
MHSAIAQGRLPRTLSRRMRLGHDRLLWVNRARWPDGRDKSAPPQSTVKAVAPPIVRDAPCTNPEVGHGGAKFGQ